MNVHSLCTCDSFLLLFYFYFFVFIFVSCFFTLFVRLVRARTMVEFVWRSSLSLRNHPINWMPIALRHGSSVVAPRIALSLPRHWVLHLERPGSESGEWLLSLVLDPCTPCFRLSSVLWLSHLGHEFVSTWLACSGISVDRNSYI